MQYYYPYSRVQQQTSYTTYLLAAIGIVFILQLAIPGFTETFYLNPKTVLSAPWQLVTSMFLHGSLTHIFFNGFTLIMFGPLLEQLIGGRKFLEVYFGTGILGGLLYLAGIYFGITAPLPALGASGALMGVLGTLAVLRPNMQLYVWFIPMPMYMAVFVWFFLDLLGVFSPTSTVGNLAHIGGLLGGLAYGYLYKKTGGWKIY
ncbi:Rhomboid family protein [Candidatus Anstonella stagnisolia]|nr:Rhomboid family protein [Candidatus Anstonella stagnisolia]